MFKYIFGIAVLILVVIGFFPTISAWGLKTKEYFLSQFNKEE